MVKFLKILDDKKSDFNSISFINDSVTYRYEGLLDFIYKILEESSSKKEPKTTNPTNVKKKNNNNCIWWNETCDKANRKRNALFRSIHFRCILEMFINHKKLEAQTVRTLKNGKVNSFKNLCTSIYGNTNISDVWRNIKAFKNGLDRPTSLEDNKKAMENKSASTNCTPPKITIYVLITISMNLSIHTSRTMTNPHFMDLPFSYEELPSYLQTSNQPLASMRSAMSYSYLCQNSIKDSFSTYSMIFSIRASSPKPGPSILL